MQTTHFEIMISEIDGVKNTLWEKEKMLVTSISPFPTIFSKAFVPRVDKGRDCVTKG